MGPVGHLRKSMLDNKHHGPLGQVHCIFIACAVTILCLRGPLSHCLAVMRLTKDAECQFYGILCLKHEGNALFVILQQLMAS